MKLNVTMSTRKTEIGSFGEEYIAKILESRGFVVLDMNYRKKCGEIDVVVKKDEMIRFIEVKTVTRETIEQKQDMARHAGRADGVYRPEDNVHYDKLRRIARTIEVYLLEKRWKGEWVFDCAMVYVNKDKKVLKVEYLQDQHLF